jgi:hypothetical protein
MDPSGRTRHRRVLGIAVGATLAATALMAGCASTPRAAAPHPPAPTANASTTSPPPTSTDGSVSGVAVGDIVCQEGGEVSPGTCRQQETADLASSLHPQFVLALGDLQYESGALDQFEAAWGPTWGRFDDILSPAPGNHEYRTTGAAGYLSYFHTPAWSARIIGTWRVYLLDSDCDHVDCTKEAAWLTQQLADSPSTCTAIAMHHPRVSSGPHGDNAMVEPLWRAAVDGGVDLALTAHDHEYERFGHLDAEGRPTDPGEGVRELVVGTGGRSLYTTGAHQPGSEFVQDQQFGVLHLTLDDGGYDWQFVAVGGAVLDQGSDTCQG